MKRKIYDISMPITYDMPVYKGREEKRPSLTVQSDFSEGSVYETKLHMNMHTGTHLDRTLHMIPGGSTIETLDLNQVITNCRVIDLTDVSNHITREDLLDKQIESGDFILLKTKNSYSDILEHEFIYLEKTGAEFLKDKAVIGVGIDALGIERNQPDHETHLLLMNSGVHILEGLRLNEVEEGDYFLFAAPINVIGAEAAPVRAILLK